MALNLPVYTGKVPMVREFGCCLCQRYHVREVEPELYESHLWRQSKHGYRDRPATVGEIFAIEMNRESEWQ